MKPVEGAPGQARAPRRLERGPLFRKYFLLILGFVCGALLISGAIGMYFSYQENKVALSSVQREKALGAAARIEEFIGQIERQLKMTQSITALMSTGAENLEQRRFELHRLGRMLPEVTDIAQIDAKGRELVMTSRLGMERTASGTDRSQEPAFKEAKPDAAWFGPVYFRKETEPYMQIAVRSKGGVLTLADVNLKFMWDVVTRIKIGKRGKAYVIDGTGHLVADPDIGLVLRKTDLSRLPQVAFAMKEGAQDSLALMAQDPGGVGVLTAYASIDSLGWKVFVEQPVAEVYETLNAAILRTVSLIAAGLLLSALAALWLARSMVHPIRVLQEGAARIGAGDLEQRIEVKTRDELQALAEQFNDMAGRLRESYAGLERKVEERTAELQETLEQQTATAEILKVISSSPTDVQPVFEAIVRSAAQLFEPWSATVTMVEQGLLTWRASAGPDFRASDIEEMKKVFPIALDSAESPSATAIKEAHVIEIVDTERAGNLALATRSGRAGNFRSAVFIPLIRNQRGIGTIVLTHPQPATRLNEKQLALVQTFADQAVIAIENVRLFNETKEALEQQRASAEVLGAISSSIADTKPVFEKILLSCERLFQGKQVGINLVGDDGQIWIGAYHGPGRAELERVQPFPRGDGSGSGAAIAQGRVMHYPDSQDPSVPETTRRGLRAIGVKSAIFAPMLWEGRGIGVIFVGREFAGPFSDKEVSLLRTFCDQAVIAIQNARLFREIQEKSRQLEIANKHKSDFLANMSHELRTPLNAIIGFSEVLVEKMFGEVNDKQLDYLKDIHSSGRHLLSLINDILDLSKIESGRMELDVAEFDVRAALQNAMTLVKERAQRSGVALGLDVAPSLGALRADERKFKQIMLNLLSNAVKFTPEGGTVSVAAKPNGTAVEFSVADTGVGIAPEDQQLVFEEFRQVGRDYTRKAEGTGLGLALTKRFVELHGGTIRLESAPGRGSTFSFTIPVRS